MKRAAISEIDKNIFCIFAVQVDDKLVVDDNLIEKYFNLPLPENMYILPWQTDSFFFDFHNPQSLSSQASNINQIVLNIDKTGTYHLHSVFLLTFPFLGTDPWVEKEFGVKGIGEGLVFYPIYKENLIELSRFGETVFKVKGPTHKIINHDMMQLTPQKIESAEQFVDLTLTPSRVEQAIEETCSGKASLEKIQSFLKWICEDIKKETSLEMKKNNLEYSQIEPFLKENAKKLFMELINK